MKIEFPFHMSDAELVVEAKARSGREREATAHLIAALAELDRRRLFLAAGYPSMFSYCTEELALSEPAAYNRIEVARAARAFPAILEMLGDGRLSIATVRVLAPRLTGDNHGELLAAASGKSKRKVEELMAGHFPQPEVAASVRKLPAAPAAAGAATPVAPPVPAPPASSPPRPVVAVLAPERYLIKFTASSETCEKLRQAQDLLRHAVPTGDTGKIIDRALTALLAELGRRKFAATTRPRRGRGARPGSRYIPAKVRRAVWIRDGGRCAFVGAGGHRCGTRAFLEYHHLDPYGVGGEATVETIELRCRAHNSYEAELFYGKEKMADRATRPGKSWRLGGSRQPRAVT